MRFLTKAFILVTLLGNVFGKDCEPVYKVAPIYPQMRTLLLDTKAQQMGDLKDKPVWVILMETGYADAVVTLVAVADGTTSLYLSNGGGMIGCGQHESVAKESKKLVLRSESFLKGMEKVSSCPLATPGKTTFYIVTPQGIFTYTAKESDLGDGRDLFSPLFQQAQEVISEIRLMDGKKATGE